MRNVALLWIALICGPNHIYASDLILEPADPQNGALFGNRVSLVDDINGDGHVECVVGAPGFDHDLDGDGIPEANVGRVDIFSGLDSSILLTVFGTQAGGLFGFSVAGGGDFDGDGIPDFAVGTPEFDNAGEAATGGAWIYRGTDGQPLFEVLGTLQNEFVGKTVAYLGNLPRDETFGPDTFGDFAIGVPSSSLIPSRRVLVVGHVMTSAVDHATLTTTIAAPSSGNNGAGFGDSVASLDFDADGVLDLAIGAPNANSLQGFSQRGRVYVYSGLDLATTLFFRDGQQNNNQRLGAAVANAGDFDGVPGDELVVGSRGYQPSGGPSNAGAVDVYAFVAGDTTGARRLRVEGDEGNMQLGSSLTSVGDFDGDGLSDIASGQAGSSTSYLGGNAYVFAGATTDTTESLSTSTRLILRASDELTIFNGDAFGASLVGGCDTDGDGYPELFVGAPNRANVGEVVAFENGPEAPDPELSGVFASPSVISAFAGQAVIEVTPRQPNGVLYGPGAMVELTTTGGQLLDAVIDVGDGTYTQVVEADPGATSVLITAIVNGVELTNSATIAIVPVDAAGSLVEVDATTTFLGSLRTVTVTPCDDAGLPVGLGLDVTITSDFGSLLGPTSDLGDGRYRQLIVTDVIGRLTIDATVDGLTLTTSLQVNVLDPAPVGSIIGASTSGSFFAYPTVQDAVDLSAADSVHTIYVAPGNYAEVVRIANRNDLRVEALSALSPVIVEGFDLRGSGAITVANFDVDASQSGRDGVRIRSRDDVGPPITIRNCTMRGATDDHGIRVETRGRRVSIESCTIFDCEIGVAFLGKDGGTYSLTNSSVVANSATGLELGKTVTALIQRCTILDNGVGASGPREGYGIFRRRSSGGAPTTVTLIGNLIDRNNGTVVPGRSDREIGNYDQIIDASDDQPGY